MFGLGNAAEVKHQQHQDHLRRAERERLAQEATADSERLAVLQSIGNHLVGLLNKKGEDHRAGTGKLTEKSML